MIKYYDTVLTPQTQKIYLEGGVNRYKETDDRVAIWFNPIPQDSNEYKRDFDVDGFPILIIVPPKTPEELLTIELAYQNAEGQRIIKEHIQKVIVKYNEDHGVDFMNVDSCLKYTTVTYNYPHKAFCIDVVNFNAETWDTGRGVQKDIASGIIELPDEGEFIAMLPVYSGTV